MYGVGEFTDEDTIKIDAYTDQSSLEDCGRPCVEPAPWGTLRFELQDCKSARLEVETDFPGFNSGSLELDRLTYINAIGCTQGGG